MAAPRASKDMMLNSSTRADSAFTDAQCNPSPLFLGRFAEYLVYDTIFDCLFGTQIEVPVGVMGNLLHRLPRVLGQNIAYCLLNPHDFSSGNLDVRCLPLRPTSGLVQMYGAIGQGVPFAFGARAKQYRTHAGRQADTNRDWLSGH
jgi:hypothetical protein